MVNLGHTNINTIRLALQRNQLDIDQNARVGVQFYEDFQEKMDRLEVEKIGEIVSKAVKKYFRDAEVSIMGSYRRGSARCGDVDILITHPKVSLTKFERKPLFSCIIISSICTQFVTFVPKGALDDLVERLRHDGYISHHLTKVDPVQREIFHQRRGNFDDLLMNASKKAESYMGVFISPSMPRKHRRIDIKFYPYREKAFASLYFTGNGWFNRAMRWYAKSKKKMTLNDKSLYPIDTANRMKAKSEQDIFDLLGLVYKRPHERDSFNALVPKQEGLDEERLEIGIDHSDFQAESKHVWVD